MKEDEVIIIHEDDAYLFVHNKLSQEGEDVDKYNVELLVDIFFDYLVEKDIMEIVEVEDEKEI